LSSVETRHPERVAGLVYLDAIGAFAYYDRSRGDFSLDLQELQRNLEQLKRPPDQLQLAQALLQDKLPQFERDLQQFQKLLQAQPAQPARPPVPSADDLASFPAYRSWYAHAYGLSYPESEIRLGRESTPEGRVGKFRSTPASSAIIESLQKDTEIRVPVLAICAIPHERGPFAYNNSAERAVAEAMDADVNEAQAKAFESGVPSARVVRLPHANHYVFLSNEADVLREIRAFLAGVH
jgi:non-heme chloroperoxidase